MTQPVFRFAPSPNGELHLGHALSALTNQAMAASVGGRLLLRIEDIDTQRCTPEFEAAIFRDLEWLGIAWERPVRRQSEHFAEYGALLDRLVAEDLVYPAFMSRGEIRAHIAEAGSRGRDWPHDPDGVPLYPPSDRTLGQRERKRRMAAGEPFAWRLDMEAALQRVAGPLAWTEFSDQGLSGSTRIDARPEAWGDVILARRDVPTSYHLSVIADDAVQAVSHVIRGTDLYAATGIQRLLQALLGLPEPSYFHHRLMLGGDGRKLSKSDRSTSLSSLRAAGHRPDDIRRLVGL